MHPFKTEQERFWAREFADGYMDRNRGDRLLQSNLFFWRRALRSMPRPQSIAELGCNIGMNLQALHRLDPHVELTGYEINEQASQRAAALGIARITTTTIVEPIESEQTFSLTFTKGVLIHVNPDYLEQAYANLFNLSQDYILVAEYYNPRPVTVNYRGHEDRLFKRDFCGEMLERYPLDLVDYGFVYHRDNYAPQDDVNWFLMRKK